MGVSWWIALVDFFFWQPQEKKTPCREAVGPRCSRVRLSLGHVWILRSDLG
jgi:hypothetical protein